MCNGCCNSFLGTGNRLPERKSLEKDILTVHSRYGTHCIVTCVVRFLVKESTPFLLSLVDRDGSAVDP